MNNRDLIEAAAWACKLPECGWMGPAFMYVKDNRLTAWNPLDDDGDAIWLASQIGIFEMPIAFRPRNLPALANSEEFRDEATCAAVRLEIVRAAARLVVG